jgi:glucan biosynthesis protein C
VQTAPNPGARVHWVDWLKVLAVLAIFLYHVALVFSVTPWMISNAQHSLVLSAVAGWGYLWGLQLLFVLAGASSYFARRRRSAPRFARERLLRLGVPLAVGLVTLSPLQAYWQALGAGSQLSLAAFLPGYLRSVHLSLDPVWLIRYGYHLWFLGFLLVVSLAALPVQGAMDRLPAGWRRRFPAERTWPRLAIFAPVAGIAVVQLLLRPAFPADMSWPDLASDLVFYLGGYALAGSRGFQAAVRGAPALCGVAALAAWSGIGLLFLARVMPGWNQPYGFDLPAAVFATLHALGAWAWALFLISIAMRWANRPAAAITYGNDAILPFYVIHHPVVVLLALYVVRLPLGVWPKFGLLFCAALLLSLAIYEVLIRHLPPLRFLFGLQPHPARLRPEPAAAY